MPFDKSGKWTPFSAQQKPLDRQKIGQHAKAFLEKSFGMPALPEQETFTPYQQPEQAPKVTSPSLPPNVNPEFAAKFPTVTNILEFLSRPARAAMETPFVQRAGQAGSEVMGMIDRPDKVSTGSKFGDISADLLGGLMGFVPNPASAGAKLWGGAERLIGESLPLIPKAIPEIAQTGLKMAGATVPYEATRAIVNDREFSPGEAGLSAAANALLGMVLHGGGKALEGLRRPGEAPVVEAPGLRPEAGPTKAETPKPSAYRLPDSESMTMERLNQGIEGAQNYVKHNDILAAYPPGTTVEAALADIKANTGIDLPQLIADVEAVQAKGGLRKQVAEEAQFSRLGMAAGAIPQPAKVSGLGRQRILGGKRVQEYSLAPPLQEVKTKPPSMSETAKEPWQMTQDEFRNNARKFVTAYGRPAYYDRIQKGKGVSNINAKIDTAHFLVVRDAVSAGKPVPPEVLREYPQLRNTSSGTTPPLTPEPPRPEGGPLPQGVGAQNGFLGQGSISAAKFTVPEKYEPAKPGEVLEPVSPKDIQTARAEIKSIDDVLKINETPEGPTMLYSGIPAEKVAESVQKATLKLQDALGIPERGGKVEVIPKPEAKEPGLLTLLKSPSRVAQKYPEVKPYVENGNKATEVQERLRNAFNKRLAEIDKTLGGSSTIPITKPLEKSKAILRTKSYKENKKSLHEILLTGDMMGKRFTEAELRSEFGANDAVIRAYNLTRSAYDHAHTIASSVRELRGKSPVNYREGYIPHFFHSWFIVADGQVVGSAKTLREAVSISNPVVREKGIDIKIVPKTFDFPGADVQAAVIGDMNYFKLKSKVEKDFGISAADAQALLEGVARMKGRSRFVGNFMERKGVQGWDKNLDWVNRHYFNMISRYAALDQFKSKAITQFERTFGSFDKDHTGTAKYIKDYINDVNGNPTAIEELLNNSLAKVPGFSKFLGTYLGDRPSLQLASATTNVVAIAKLGLYNVSSAMVNASQLINSYAKLGEKWTAQGLKKAARLTPTERGILKQIGVDTQLGLESGAGYSKAGQMGKIFQNSLVLFKGVDTFLRRATGLGAYHKAISEGKTKQQAIEYAKQIIDQTQFNYGIAETPAFIRRSGPVGQVLFQFKKYPVKQLEFMTQLKGAENARFWIPFTLISGYYALPGLELLKNSVKSMFDVDIELEAKKYLMNWAGSNPEKQKIAKTIMYGIGSNAGVDISRRIGGGDYIPSEGKDLLGPTISTVVRAAQLAAKKEWIEALRAISPSAGNLVLMLETDGQISDPWNRGRLKAKLKPEEKALKALGFTIAGESIERDKSKAIVYSEQRRKESEQKAIDGFIKAVQGKDRAAAMNQVKELEKMGITPQRVMDEMKKKKMLPTQRAITNVPKKEVKEYIDIYRFK